MKTFVTPTKLIVLTVLVVFAFGFYLLYSYAFIEVRLATQTGVSEISYTITNQQSGKRTEAKTSVAKLRKLVKRGNYEVFVKQDKKSSLLVKQTGGFLGTTQASATLLNENARTFVGNNPNPCMYLVTSILVTGPCEGMVEELEFHIPADARQATYTKKAIGPAATLEAVLPFAGGAIAVVRAEAEGETNGNFHAVYSLDSSGVFSTTNIRELRDLDGAKQYTLAPYSKGYVAVSSDGSHVLYYASFDQKPTVLSFERPADQNLAYRSMTAEGDSLVVIFSNVNKEELPNFDDPGGDRAHSKEVEAKISKKPQTEIVIRSDTATQRISLKKSVVQATLCAQNKLCILLASGSLEVYQLGDSGQELLFSLTGVLEIQKQQDRLRVIKSDGVFLVDIQKQEGYRVYSFGSYAFCGTSIQTATNIVCIANADGARRTISINTAQENIDDIDSKVAELEKFSHIKALSIYGSYLHVSPELGKLTYQESTGRFGYNPVLLRTTSDAIDAEVKRLGIDISKYTVVNPYR